MAPAGRPATHRGSGGLPPRAGSWSLARMSLPPPSPAREDWEPRRWAVLGASGFIGSATVEHLAARAADVQALPAPRVELSPLMRASEDVAALAEDHPETGKLAEALEGVDVVINAAGVATPDGRASAALYGANSLLPVIIASAAIRANVGRVIQLSSAAVQGDRRNLNASPEVAPFSAYSHSKALGEGAVLALAGRGTRDTDILIIRATSVQGPGRATTEALRRVARSPFCSVAAPGDYPTVVSSLGGLTAFIYEVGRSKAALPPILLQPWEGLNVRQVLELAGDRSPSVLPRWLCRGVLATGKLVGSAVPKVAGLTRRVEIMWFGQMQEGSGLPHSDPPDPNFIVAALKATEDPA